MPCKEQILIKGVEVDSQLQPEILKIMKNNPHLVLDEVNLFIEKPLDSINELNDSHYEDVADRMYNYFTNKSFIDEFGDWQNDDTPANNKYNNGEPRLFYDKNLKKHYYRNKFNDKIYFPLNQNGLHYIYNSDEVIEQGVKYLAFKFFQSNFNQDYNDLSFISKETLSESIRQIIMNKINEYSNTDQDYLADELRESLYYLNEWTDKVRNYFLNLGFKVEETDVEIQNEEENSTQELVRRSSLEKDSKDQISSNIKAFLSFIPDYYNTVDLVFEESGFVEFEDIYNTLQTELANISPTLVNNNVEDVYKIMLNKIGELSHKKPYFKELLNILNHPSLTEEKKSEFTQAFSLVKYPYFVSEVEISEKSLKFSNKDVSQVNANFNNIKKQWSFNFNNKFNNEGILNKTELSIINDDIKIVRSDFDKLRRIITNVNELISPINKIIDIFRSLGVETTEEGFNSYIGNLSDVQIDIDTLIDKVNKLLTTTEKSIKDLLKGNKFHNIINKQGLFTELAKEEAFYLPDGSDATIFSSGKSYWVFSLPSHIQGEINKWKSNIEELENLYREPGNDSSKILTYLLAKDQKWVRESDRIKEAEDRISKVKSGVFNVFQNKKTENIKSDPKNNVELSKDDAIIDSINRALLNSKGERSLFNTPTPADKSTSYLISHNYFLNTHVNEIQDGRPIIPEHVVQVFYDYFSSEYDRMVKSSKVINDPDTKKYVYYHTDKNGNTHKNGKVIGNAFKSQIFEGLSFNKIENVLPEIANILYNKDGTPALQALYPYENQIKDYISNILSNSILNKIEVFKSKDIIIPNTKVKGSYEAKGIDSTIMKQYKIQYEYPVLTAISDYHINTLLNNIEYSKIFSGDPAYYKNMVDYAKRIPATYTDGLQLRLLNNDDLTFNAAIISGVEISSKNLDELKELVGEEIASMYDNNSINSTDAQAWITPKRWKFLINRLGLWSKYHDSAYSKMLGDNKDPFTDKEIKAVAQPLKGVYFKMNNGVPTYLKYSQAVLLPTVIEGSDLQRMYNKMVDNNIDEVITLDGIKVGATIPDKVHNEDGTLKLNFDLTPLKLDNRGWKLQQNLPTKGFKDTDVGSQIQKNVLAGLAFNLDSNFNYNNNLIKGKDLYKEINNIIGSLSQKGIEEFTKELDIDDSGKINNIESLYSLLLKEAKKRNINDNLIKALEKEISIYGIPQSHSKLMNMFFSIVKDRIVKIKTNGGSFIQVSNFGIDKLTDPQKTGVKWFIDPKKGLKPPHFLKDENGEYILNEEGNKIIKPGQILLPGSLLTKYIPNWKELDPDELKVRISPEILENIIGYRIPNQGLSSNDALEIVGFLPEGVGDAVVAYSEIPTKTGSDFDIDKMYIMIPSFTKRNGDLIYYKPKLDEENNELPLNEQPKEVLQNKLIEAYKSVFLHSEVIKDVMTPIDFDYIKNDITSIFKDDEFKPDLYHFDGINQIDLKYQFLAGKAGVGQTANMLVDHVRGMFIDTTLYDTYIGRGHSNDLGYTLFDREYSEELDEKDVEYISSLLDIPIDNVKKYKISNSISAFLNAFVDIAKDPYVTRGNWTTQTSNTGFMMLRAGIHPMYVNRFIGQPIIKEYIDFVTNAESKFNNEKGNIRNKFKEYYAFKNNEEIPNKLNLEGLMKSTLKQLDNQIKNPTFKQQFTIIEKFFQLQDHSKKLIQSINASKPDVTGAGKDLSSRFIIQNLIEEIENNDYNNIKGALTNFSDKLIDPNTEEESILGHYINNSIYWIDTIIKNNPKIFLLGNKNIEKTFNTISKQLRGTKLLNEQIADQLYSDFYSYSLSSFDGLSIKNPAIELFINLGKEISDLKLEDDFNYFLQQLEVIEEDGINFIRLQNKKRSKNIQNKLYRGWKDLMDSNPEIARKLIKYSYYQSGFKNNINEFFTHIPHEYFVETKFNQFIYELNNEINDVQHQFIDQFYRHNWDNTLIVPNIFKNQVKTIQKDISYLFDNEYSKELPLFVKYNNDLLKLEGYNSDGNGIYVKTFKLGLSKKNGGIIEYKFDIIINSSQIGENNPNNLKDIKKYLKNLNPNYNAGEFDLYNNQAIPNKDSLNRNEKDFNNLFNNEVINDINKPDLSNPNIDNKLDEFNKDCKDE